MVCARRLRVLLDVEERKAQSGTRPCQRRTAQSSESRTTDGASRRLTPEPTIRPRGGRGRENAATSARTALVSMPPLKGALTRSMPAADRGCVRDRVEVRPAELNWRPRLTKLPAPATASVRAEDQQPKRHRDGVRPTRSPTSDP